jgi:DNA-directed RNA polymerase subunit RPC12/RpoP
MAVNMVDLVEKDQYVYECDECKHAFKAAEIKLVDPADNVILLGHTIMCVEKDGTICSKPNPSKADGDKLLACPKCGQIHLFGLNLKGLRR